jgi:small-conductance mechanosensitive channel
MPSIRDILRFRHALSYLHDTYPFGDDFGPAANRDECIASSHRDFWLLMKLAPLKQALPFDVLKLIARNKDGAEDKAKVMAIRRLFRPNASNNITLLAFVQSCDTIYKHFRFFRASLSNANVINDAIQHMMNAAFFFVLTLLLLSVMNLSPISLLFSITSLLVSVSFALGSSVSKYVEGMLLIVRRPYDLGDRIFFSSADAINPEPDVTRASWFVEDISLSATKLRYARTNEVSTVVSVPINAYLAPNVSSCHTSTPQCEE